MIHRQQSLQSADVNDFALNVLQLYTENLGYSIIQIGLSSALFGILTSLVAVALFFLIRTRSVAMRVLLPSTLLLYISTSVYMAAEIWHISSVDAYISGASRGLFSASYGPLADGYDAFEWDVKKQSWMFTAALGFNVFLGDAIVWWRTCVVWRHRFVYCLGAVLLSVTVVCGSLGVYYTPRVPSMNALFKYQGNGFAVTSAVLSFATNVLATSLIGYKTWEHRKLLRKHFCEGHRQTRVLRGLALLVESGAIYCVLLGTVIVDQGVNRTVSPASPSSTFQEIEQDYTYDCFVPIVAIYPVLIIALIALNQSPIDSGFSQHGIVVSSAARRGGDAVMTSTVVFHQPDSIVGGSSSSSDASSVGDAVDARHDGSKDMPSRRVALDIDKSEDQKEKGIGQAW